MRPVSTPAPATAHAPVPHASVTPQPRSQTTMLTCAASTTSTNSALTFREGRRVHLDGAARGGQVDGAGSSTNATECGLPIDTAGHGRRARRPRAARPARAPSVGAARKHGAESGPAAHVDGDGRPAAASGTVGGPPWR